MMRQSEFKIKYTRQHIYGEWMMDVFKSFGSRLFGKTMKTVCLKHTLGQQQQNLGLGWTIIGPVLERIQGFLLRVETSMIFYIDIFLARDTMVLRMSVYS